MTATMNGHAPIGADVLSRAEAIALSDCEDRIERGMKTFIEVGMALAAIQQNRLYRAQFDTFEEYCAARWNFTGRRGRQLIEAAEIGTMVPIENERQARALVPVPESERAEVLAEAAARTGGTPTAKAINEVVKERTSPSAAPKPTGTPGPVEAPSTAPADPGPNPAPVADAPMPPQEPDPEPSEPSAQSRELAAEIKRDSVRRVAVASIRSVLTYLTSRVLTPEDLAREYQMALAEFTAADLRFAAETMAALAALKEQ